jgi:hypothetical protein
MNAVEIAASSLGDRLAFTLARRLACFRALGRYCSYGTSLICRAATSWLENTGGIRSNPISSSHSPEKKYRATSTPPDTCTPTCPRYPVPSADASWSSKRLNAETLSWRQNCGSLGARTVCVRKHCTPLVGVELVDAVVPVRQPRYAVGHVL